jgi:hypothetical protein
VTFLARLSDHERAQLREAIGPSRAELHVLAHEAALINRAAMTRVRVGELR